MRMKFSLWELAWVLTWVATGAILSETGSLSAAWTTARNWLPTAAKWLLTR